MTIPSMIRALSRPHQLAENFPRTSVLIALPNELVIAQDDPDIIWRLAKQGSAAAQINGSGELKRAPR